MTVPLAGAGNSSRWRRVWNDTFTAPAGYVTTGGAANELTNGVITTGSTWTARAPVAAGPEFRSTIKLSIPSGAHFYFATFSDYTVSSGNDFYPDIFNNDPAPLLELSKITAGVFQPASATLPAPLLLNYVGVLWLRFSRLGPELSATVYLTDPALGGQPTYTVATTDQAAIGTIGAHLTTDFSAVDGPVTIQRYEIDIPVS